MKKSYSLIKASNTNISCDFKGSYKKIDDKRSFSSLNKVRAEISGTYLTEWRYEFFEITKNSTSTSLFSQTLSVKQDQRISLLQQLSEALEKDNNLEFCELLYKSNVRNRDFKKNSKQVKSKNFFKPFSKFFTKYQKVTAHQDFESEKKFTGNTFNI